MEFCPNCETRLDKDDKFCLECGTPVKNKPNYQSESHVVKQSDIKNRAAAFSNAKDRVKIPKPAIIISSIGAGVLLILLTFLILNGSFSDRLTEGALRSILEQNEEFSMFDMNIIKIEAIENLDSDVYNKFVLINANIYQPILVNTKTKQATQLFIEQPYSTIASYIFIMESKEKNIENFNKMFEYMKEYGVDCFSTREMSEEYLSDITDFDGIIPTITARNVINDSYSDTRTVGGKEVSDFTVLFERGSAVPVYFTGRSVEQVWNWTELPKGFEDYMDSNTVNDIYTASRQALKDSYGVTINGFTGLLLEGCDTNMESSTIRSLERLLGPTRIPKTVWIVSKVTTGVKESGIFYSLSDIMSGFDVEDINTLSKMDNSSDINVLITGRDKSGTLTDAVIVASFNRQNKKIRMLSIPRDTRFSLINYPSKINGSYGKVNALPYYARQIKQTHLPRKEIGEFLNINIDYYIDMEMVAFVKIVDFLGGVEITIPQRMKYSDPVQNLKIDFEVGTQHLDGQKALEFALFRTYINGDLGRIEAQQKLMNKLYEDFINNTNLIQKLKLGFDVIRNHTKTNIRLKDLADFIKYIPSLNSDSIEFITLPGEARTIGGISYFVSESDETKYLFSHPAEPEHNEVASTVSYVVRVSVDKLDIHIGPGTSYEKNGSIDDRSVYTITEENISEGTRWGKLKSGVGWINLDYCEKE